MPYTVPVSFDRFIENISLTGDHKQTAEDRRAAIVSLLENTFEVLDSFPTGSIPKGTALKSHADLDVMAVLHWTKHIEGKTPAQVLQRVRDALGKYRTNVRKNGQAVTLYYDSWPSVDIVPVGRIRKDDGSISHYTVPDMNTGRWLESRPRRHANAISAKAKECGSQFKPLVRMIKEWNKQHSDLMESYHLEVLALNACDGPLSDYPWDVFCFLEKAAELAAAPLAYAGGYADDYLDSAADRQAVVRRLETARDRARDAWHLTYDGRTHHERAITIWRQIFGDRFPAYG
jgi:hypothetical protein